MRSTTNKYGNIFIILGLIVVFIGQVLLIRNKNLGPELALKNEAEKVKLEITNSQKIISTYGRKIVEGKELPALGVGAVAGLDKEGVDVFIFKESNPVFWTTQDFNVYPRFRTGLEIQKHGSKYIMFWTYFTDTAEFIFTHEIISNTELRFVGNSSVDAKPENVFAISTNPLVNSIPVELPGIPRFYLVIEHFSQGITFDLLIILGLVILSLGILDYFRHSKIWYLGGIINIVYWLLIEGLFYKNITLWNLKSKAIFTPEIYASSNYFPNLGILLFDALLAFSLATLLLHITLFFSNKWTEKRRKILWIIALGICGVYFAFFLMETGKLVRDSSITYDFHEIHLISIFTILGIVAIALGFGVLFRLVRIIKILKPSTQPAWVLALPAIIIIAISTYLFREAYPGLAIMYFLFLSALIFYDLLVTTAKSWWTFVSIIFIPCIITGIIINKFVNNKELELREILAAKLLLQSEREPSNLLLKTESAIEKDKGIVDYYTCTDESKSDFEKRLRQLYFSEYTENFEILIFDYNNLGESYREMNPLDYVSVNNLFQSDACKPVTRYFSIVNERKLKGSFLGKFNVQDSGNKYGTFFIMLKPRLSAAQGRFSEVFQKSPLESLFADNQYSYAFYTQNRLSRRYGQYNYLSTFTLKLVPNLILEGGYSHFTYSDDLGNIIVISKPMKSALQNLTVFTILVLGTLIGAFLIMIAGILRQAVINNRKIKFRDFWLMQVVRRMLPVGTGSNLFLSRKLQMYVILVVFLTFIVVLFVTINYFKNSYSQRQKEFLWNKTNEIANTIGTQANLDALFNRFQTGLIYDLSNYYNSDINIYTPSGKLLVSSNDRIYDEGFSGSLMNPLAYQDFTKRGISGFIKEEKLGDLKYISAFYTIFDNDLNVKGYLNLPYFTNRQDLWREISTYGSTVINLFALVFALAALLAYVIAHRITEPLNLIRHQIGLVRLGAKNAPIHWEHNDEIGLLIAEYNNMIEALEESSNRLAESERQGAWREMAKQVAHEIKNPLTPMKLSLQHLQYAMERKDENVEEKFKKTIDLLINQIESLSKMAEEFSAFAKMPEALNKNISLHIILDEAVNLFSKEENLEIEYQPIPDSIYVHADRHQLARVFTNIIKNASQAIPSNTVGKLAIHHKYSNASITIYFEDNGKGIPLDLRNKIFSPNFSTKNSGMGLGLAISRKILEQFEGNIDFTSNGNSGTTFYVTIPAFEM